MVNVKVGANKPWVFVAGILVGALSFTVALAWNEFVVKVLRDTIGVDDSILGILIYTVIVTVILIVAAYILAKFWPAVLEVI